jgi:hypothetical protein
MQLRSFVKQEYKQSCEERKATHSSMKGNHQHLAFYSAITVCCELRFQGKRRTIEMTWGETGTTQAKGK